MSLNNFKASLEKLQNIITKLEVNTGAQHQYSEVDQLLGKKKPVVLIAQQKQQNVPKTQIQPVVQTKVVQPLVEVQPIVEVQPVIIKKQEPVVQTKPEVVVSQQVPQKKPVAQKAQKKEKKKNEKKQEKKEQTKEKKEVKKKEQKKQEQKTEKAEPEKRESKEQELAQPTIEDFAQIDIRVSSIVQCWKHPASENLYCQKINIGGEIRQIASGLQKYVPIQLMSGPVLVMANLKPRKLADFMSNGMVVANSTPDHSQVTLIVPQGVLGQRVTVQGFENKFVQEKQPVLNPKKKILEKCLPKLKSDAQGFATWNGYKLKTSGGYISCTFPNANIS